MKRSVQLLIAFVVITVIGCGAPDILYIPSPPQGIVVNCLTYNYHPFQAFLSTSRGILENDPGGTIPIIQDATVKLYENEILVETFAHDTTWSTGGTRYYSITSTPQPGKRYKLTADRPGLPTATAEYLQPDSVAILSVSVRKIGPNVTYPYLTDVQFRVQFTDPPGEDFYELDAIHITDSLSYSFPGDTTVYKDVRSDDPYFQVVDPAYADDNDLVFSAITFNDLFFDGKTATLDLVAQIDGGFSNKRTYLVYLRHTSKEYYKYIRSVYLQSTTSGDPFAQPVLLENNFTNGYGIFAGFTQTKMFARSQN